MSSVIFSSIQRLRLHNRVVLECCVTVLCTGTGIPTVRRYDGTPSVVLATAAREPQRLRLRGVPARRSDLGLEGSSARTRCSGQHWLLSAYRGARCGEYSAGEGGVWRARLRSCCAAKGRGVRLGAEPRMLGLRCPGLARTLRSRSLGAPLARSLSDSAATFRYPRPELGCRCAPPSRHRQ